MSTLREGCFPSCIALRNPLRASLKVWASSGTGRYNMVFGLVSTCVQVGAACSLLIGEYIVEIAGGV